MFADAYEKAAAYTFPVVVSTRSWQGTVSSTLAAFVILNDEGWFATAAHVISPHMVWCRHATEIAAYQEAIAASRTKPGKAKGAKDLRPNPDWIVNQSFWWGSDGPQMVTVHVREGRRPGGRPPCRPSSLARGRSTRRSWTRLGCARAPACAASAIPFTRCRPSGTPRRTASCCPQASLPPPLFPIEGIFTRQVRKPGDEKPIFIETSSPGLRGQSGGPRLRCPGPAVGDSEPHPPSRSRFFPAVPGAAGERCASTSSSTSDSPFIRPSSCRCWMSRVSAMGGGLSATRALPL